MLREKESVQVDAPPVHARLVVRKRARRHRRALGSRGAQSPGFLAVGSAPLLFTMAICLGDTFEELGKRGPPAALGLYDHGPLNYGDVNLRTLVQVHVLCE